MDRGLVFPGAIPLETDVLFPQVAAMKGLAGLSKAVLGATTTFEGLACTPTGPGSLSFIVGIGAVYAVENVDDTDFSSIPADTTHQIVKQGLLEDPVTLTTIAPVTVGYARNYLVQAIYADADVSPVVLSYYNASNPSVAWSGPGNSGASQFTRRKGVCIVSAKAGAAATAGTQVTPSPDAGYTGLYVVTVAYGQTVIATGDISKLASAPFIPITLPAVPGAVQSGQWLYAGVAGGTANALTAALSPAPAALVAGMKVFVKISATNTAAMTLNLNTLGVKSVVNLDGSAVGNGAAVLGQIAEFDYDGTRFQFANPTGTAYRKRLSTDTNFYISSSGNDTTGTGASGAPWLTLQKAVDTICLYYDIAGFNCYVNIAAGTYAGAAQTIPAVGGNIQLVGAGSASVTIAGGSQNAISASFAARLKVSGAKLTSTSASGVYSANGGATELAGDIEFGACGGTGQMVSAQGGLINVTGNCKVSGNAAYFALADFGSSIVFAPSAITVNVSGAPVWSGGFFGAARNSIVIAQGNTYTGVAGAGPHFNAVSGGLIDLAGAGGGTLPGSTSGTTATGGQVV